MGDDGSEPDDYTWNIGFFEGFLNYDVSSRSTSTRRSELRHFDEHWCVPKGIESIEDITYRHVKLYAKHQSLDVGYANKTIEGRIYAVKKALDEAFREGEISEHPLALPTGISELIRDWGISTSQTKREKLLEEHDFSDKVTEEQYEKLRENVPAPKNRNQCLIDLIFWTGMRADEVGYILMDDLNLNEHTVRHPDRKKDDPEAMRTSNYSPSCDISLSAWMGERQRYNCLADAQKDWLFCSRKSAPLKGNQVGRVVRDAADRAGIQTVLGKTANGKDILHINTHALRKGHGSWAVDKVGIHRVKEQLGHASVEVTEKTYVDTDPDDDENPYKDIYQGTSPDEQDGNGSDSGT